MSLDGTDVLVTCPPPLASMVAFGAAKLVEFDRLKTWRGTTERFRAAERKFEQRSIVLSEKVGANQMSVRVRKLRIE